jgi:hypothetical protein
MLAVSAACLALAFPAMAAAPIAPTGAKVMAALDTNKDGFVDHNEFRAGQDALFQRVDTNHDGVISQAEFNAAAQRIGSKRAAATNSQAQPGKSPADRAARLFSRIDTNKDGVISHDEYLMAGDKLFTRCDKDGDGKIAPGECRTRRASAQPQQQQPQPPRQ